MGISRVEIKAGRLTHQETYLASSPSTHPSLPSPLGHLDKVAVHISSDMSTVLTLGLLVVGMFGFEIPDATGYVVRVFVWLSRDLQFEFAVACQEVESGIGWRGCVCMVGCKVGVPLVGMIQVISCVGVDRGAVVTSPIVRLIGRWWSSLEVFLCVYYGGE